MPQKERKIVVIFGAGSLIGIETCRELINKGYTIIPVLRNKSERVVFRFKLMYEDLILIGSESSPESVGNITQQVEELFGGCHAVLYIAGHVTTEKNLNQQQLDFINIYKSSVSIIADGGCILHMNSGELPALLKMRDAVDQVIECVRKDPEIEAKEISIHRIYAHMLPELLAAEDSKFHTTMNLNYIVTPIVSAIRIGTNTSVKIPLTDSLLPS